ncbi:MAG: enoyl-CoA hydratase/isomerase family protein [Chloroflexia bacterium]
MFVKMTVEDRVAVVTIDHPPVNVLDTETFAELGEVIEEIAGNKDVRAVVITGAGQAFVAGADIKQLGSLQSSEQARGLLGEAHAFFDKVDNLPVPVIAAVNGYCLGGGNELALACDFRLASDRARFGQPEINLGIIPGFGGTVRLTRLIGPARALELMLLGSDISAQEALRFGLVNNVVREARNMARVLASKPAGAVQAILEMVQEGYGKPQADALEMERGKFSALVGTPDMREGLSAFLEKRKPSFQ